MFKSTRIFDAGFEGHCCDRPDPGDGAERHSDQIRGAGFPVLPPPLGAPLADGLIRLLALSPETPALENPSTWEPSYLRATQAERLARGG